MPKRRMKTANERQIADSADLKSINIRRARSAKIGAEMTEATAATIDPPMTASLVELLPGTSRADAEFLPEIDDTEESKISDKNQFVYTYIREQFAVTYDDSTIARLSKFFPEGLLAYGVTGGKKKIADIVKDALALSGVTSLRDKMAIANELFTSKKYEECQAAVILLEKHHRNFDSKIFETFSFWLANYVTNWAVCDSLCLKLIYPCAINNQAIARRVVVEWSLSENRWLMRGACSVLSKLCRRDNTYLEEVFAVTKNLMDKNDKIIQKGLKWMLKEAYRIDSSSVSKFITKNKRGLANIRFARVLGKPVTEPETRK